MVKINIQSGKEEVEKQNQDRETYHEMIDCLLEKINNAGLHMSWIGGGGRDKERTPKKNLEISVEVLPASLLKDMALTSLYVKVHKKEALDIVTGVLEDYSDKYHNLNRIDVNTYF